MHVEKSDLEKLLELLKQAQHYRDFGDTKAYRLEREARQLVESMLKGARMRSPLSEPKENPELLAQDGVSEESRHYPKGLNVTVKQEKALST